MHLDPFQIDEAQRRLRCARLINAVDEEADRGIGVDVDTLGADAADRRAGIDTRTPESETRHEPFEPGYVSQALFLDRFGPECRNRNRHVLQIFLAALSGDNDFTDATVIIRGRRRGRSGLGRSQGWCGDRYQNGGTGQQALAKIGQNVLPVGAYGHPC